MVTLLSDLPVGTKVVEPGTKYNGVPIVWVVGGHGHYMADTTTLLTERIITIKAFDAVEKTGSPFSGNVYGLMRWKYSNIRSWLNSTSSSWYSNQHSYDNPPTKDYVWGGLNAYAQESGFLSSFSSNMLNLLEVNSVNTAYPPDSSRKLETTFDKVFLLSESDVMGKSGANPNGALESDTLPLFKNGGTTLAKPTAEAVSQSEYKNNSTLSVNMPYKWWVRTADSTNIGYSVVVSETERVTGFAQARYGDEVGVRPAISVPKNTYVSYSPTIGGYTLLTYQVSPASGTSLGGISQEGAVLNYTFNNLEGTMIVHEYVDDVHLGYKTVENGKQYSVTIPYDVFKSLKYGKYRDADANPHRIRLTGSDGLLGVYYFHKVLPNNAKERDVVEAVNDMANISMPSHKKKLVDAIGNKATVGGTGSLEDIAKAIESISEKRVATGTTATVKASHQITGQVSGTFANTLQISGLGFVPTILIYKTAGDGSYESELYFKDGFRDGDKLWSFKDSSGKCYSCATAVISEDLVYVPSYRSGTKDWVAIG